MSPLLSTLLLLACEPAAPANGAADSGSSDSGSTDSGSTDPGDTGAWDGDVGDWIEEGGDEEPPPFDAVTVGAALDEAIALAVDTHAGPILEGMGALFTGMDEDCPTWFEQDGVPYWYDSCTSDLGTTYDGYAYVVESSGLTDEEGNTWDGVQVFSLATMTSADGRVVETGGQAGLLAGWSADGAQLSYTYMDHGFADSGASSGWMAEGVDPAAVTWAVDYGEAGVAMLVDGVFTELSGDFSAVVFDQVTVMEEGLGGCAVEPAASVSMLTAEGEWFDLAFDGSDPADPSCDGCGLAAWQGVPLGEVCVDFSPMVGFDGSPWW